jgi:hypothetical protein
MGDVCLVVCMALFKAELNLSILSSTRSFYSSRSGSYIVTLGLTAGLGVVETLCNRVLMVRGSK